MRISLATLFLLVISTSLFGPTDAFGDDPAPSGSCHALLTEQIDAAIDRFSSLKPCPETAEELRKKLVANRARIEARVKTLCPTEGSCTSSRFARAVIMAVEQEIGEIEVPSVRIGARVWLIVGASVGTYIALSTAAQTYMTSITATMAVAFLTWLGTSSMDSIGAPVLEYILPPIRRWIYSANNLAWEKDVDRTEGQQRHLLLYMLQQELLTEFERTARYVDTEVVIRLMGALGAQGKHDLERSAEIFAKFITHVADQFPEIDLTDRDYRDWVDVLFTKWELPVEDRQAFVDRIFERIENHFDITTQTTPLRRERYHAILRAWFLGDTDFAPSRGLSNGAGI